METNKKIPYCNNCGDTLITKSFIFSWDESLQTWVGKHIKAIYNCPNCGECDISWIIEVK